MKNSSGKLHLLGSPTYPANAYKWSNLRCSFFGMQVESLSTTVVLCRICISFRRYECPKFGPSENTLLGDGNEWNSPILSAWAWLRGFQDGHDHSLGQ